MRGFPYSTNTMVAEMVKDATGTGLTSTSYIHKSSSSPGRTGASVIGSVVMGVGGGVVSEVSWLADGVVESP